MSVYKIFFIIGMISISLAVVLTIIWYIIEMVSPYELKIIKGIIISLISLGSVSMFLTVILDF